MKLTPNQIDRLKSMRDACQAALDGKPWQYVPQTGITETFRDGHPDLLPCDWPVARPKPWQLPAPPAGRQWHRTDWTEEMLPVIDGKQTRPLLLDERPHKGIDYVLCSSGKWLPLETSKPALEDELFQRTTRPAPLRARDAPVEQAGGRAGAGVLPAMEEGAAAAIMDHGFLRRQRGRWNGWHKRRFRGQRKLYLVGRFGAGARALHRPQDLAPLHRDGGPMIDAMPFLACLFCLSSIIFAFMFWAQWRVNAALRRANDGAQSARTQNAALYQQNARLIRQVAELAQQVRQFNQGEEWKTEQPEN